MTPREIEILQDSFALILPRRAEVSGLFCARLFELAPQARPLSKGDLEGQGAELMRALTVVIRLLGNLVPVREMVHQLARSHVRYGDRKPHYASVGRALILALREALGEAFTIEAEVAWVDAYALLSPRTTSAADEIALAA